MEAQLEGPGPLLPLRVEGVAALGGKVQVKTHVLRHLSRLPWACCGLAANTVIDAFLRFWTEVAVIPE